MGPRRNAALVLGKLGEPGAIQILARVMNNRDDGLRLQALESMAQLGSKEAKEQLKFLAHSGLGGMEVLAINALGSTEDGQFVKLYRYKLQTAAHLETKLAAARALGRLDLADGLSVAVKNLTFNRPHHTGEAAEDDSPAAQIVRTRTLAALAVGAIGDPSALPALVAAMDYPYDPRVELAVALATLQILDQQAELGSRRTGPRRR
jgi:HEAT repeat protein